jgi:hypothetical protein
MRTGITGMVDKIRTWMREMSAPGKRRLLYAMICYLALIGVALYALLPIRTDDERKVLAMVLVVFTLLIIRTLAHAAEDK